MILATVAVGHPSRANSLVVITTLEPFVEVQMLKVTNAQVGEAGELIARKYILGNDREFATDHDSRMLFV